MMRDWFKYLNSQKYSECHLVSAINAYYFYTGKTISSDGKRYEKLVDLVKGRHGPAIDIDRAWLRLGLESGKTVNDIFDLERSIFVKEKNFKPIDLFVWHHTTGLHSTLIVDASEKCDAVRLTNFMCATTTDGWIFLEDLYYYTERAQRRCDFIGRVLLER